ncbi:MAG: GOLPH3/VPS74 family protein [Longimicrobiales bacterium]
MIDMSKPPNLYLHEEVLLLALNDDSGKTQGGWFTFGLGGAMVAELLLAQRVTFEPVKKKRMVTVTRPSLVGEPLLDECMHLLNNAKRRADVATWVGKFAGIPKLRERIADRLCQRGILRRSEDRVLFVFSRQLYPMVDPRPERELTERMRKAIFQDGEVDVRTAIVTRLAYRADLLRFMADRKELKRRKSRIEALPLPATLDASVRDAIAAVHKAVEAVSAAATVAVIG